MWFNDDCKVYKLFKMVNKTEMNIFQWFYDGN